MPVNEMQSPEAGRPAPGAPKKRVTCQTLFIVLNFALMITAGFIGYGTVIKVGLSSAYYVGKLLGVSYWSFFSVLIVAFFATLFAFIFLIVTRVTAGDMIIYQLFLFMALLFTAGSLIITSFGFHHKLKTALESGIAKGMASFSENKYDRMNAYLLQETQILYNCCGWTGPQDYLSITKNLTVPLSCCTDDDINLYTAFTTCQLANATRPGCHFSEAYQYADTLMVAFIIQLVLLILLIPMSGVILIRDMDLEVVTKLMKTESI